MSFWTEGIYFPLIFNSLLTGIIASIACGVIGSYVVVKRLTFISGGIAHAVLGGMGAAYFYDFDPKWGAMLAAIVFAFIIAYIRRAASHREDTVIGALWAIGMAIGLLFIHSKPSSNSNLMSYLFGNISIVSQNEIIIIALLTLGTIVLVYIFHKQFLAICFDEEYAAVQGIAVQPIYIVLLCLIAVTVVMLIQVVGIILVIALFTLPAVISSQFSKSVVQMMFYSSILGMFFTTTGNWIAYEPSLPAGPVIILTAGFTYILSIFAAELRSKNKKKAAR